MLRLWGWSLVALLSVGCHSAQPQPMQNPFFGQTTVPPPGTGTSQTLAPPPSSYYQPPANTPYVAPPQSYAPGMQGSVAPSYAPPAGTYGVPQAYPQGVVMRPQPHVASTIDRTSGVQAASGPGWRMPVPTANLASNSSPAIVARPTSSVGLDEFGTTARVMPVATMQTVAPSTTAQSPSPSGYAARHIEPRHGEPIRIIEPRGVIAARSAVVEPTAQPEPVRFRPRGDLIEISELPVRRPQSQEIQQAVYEAPAPRRSVYAVAGPPAESRPHDALADEEARYGVDADYRWLRGRLAYDDSLDQWRLDYVAPHAPVDEFGGSVMLVDSPLLDSFREGDYLIVHGVLDDESIELDTPPAYHVDQVLRSAP